jgi:thiopeptide-type bacteriocin biosynthesis protein
MTRRARPLYEAADFFVVRAPLLSLDAYRSLNGQWRDGEPHDAGTVRQALAVASHSLLDAADATTSPGRRLAKIQTARLRYMIRMSTRPTPFALLAGVALGRWGDRTNLTLSAEPRRKRTRPDMAWLMKLVGELESMPDVRRQLRVVAHPAALIRAGRVFLAEQLSRGESAASAVSVRATRAVRAVLHAARQPIAVDALTAYLLAQIPGATTEKVDRLIVELWQLTLLLTDLRPPLTAGSPAGYVLERLKAVPAAATVCAQVQSVLDHAAQWDASAPINGAERYRALVAQAARIRPFERSPFQVDSAVLLADDRVSCVVAGEAARAAELLLRLSPFPHGPAHLALYRRQFVQRYGTQREVPLLELLDPSFGLGPLPRQVLPSAALTGLGEIKALQRAQTLQTLAATALHQRSQSLDLDDATIERLETSTAASRVPASLDLYVSVAASSRGQIDAGEFSVVVEPNVGAMAAGRSLGRFADFLPGSTEALQRIAAREEACRPDTLFAELTYQPQVLRSSNVSIRPNVRAHEIAFGVSSGRDTAHTIPLDELVVGIRDDCFYVRWIATGQEVMPTAGHMLRPTRGSAICRFLSEIGRDGYCQLAAFHWGAASTFPFLPRIRSGRVVLSLAQWRFSAAGHRDAVVHRRDMFASVLQRWREEWRVPQHVYLTAGDNRLLLDLEDAEQADEIRRELQGGPQGFVLLTEVFPDFEHVWVHDTQNRPFITELVIPLLSRDSRPPVWAPAGLPVAAPRPSVAAAVPTASVQDASPLPSLHPPGSEWLFAKLYVPRTLEDDVLAERVREFTFRCLADEWFFVRYSDPEWHLRLRFRGEPQQLLREVLPPLTQWANGLIRDGSCRRWALDTYEQEVDRFGGQDGMRAAETLFAADSRAVVDLLALVHARKPSLDPELLAVLTVDALLEGFGLDGEARFRWCRDQVRTRHEASREYRQWKAPLRRMLADSDGVQSMPSGAEIAAILDRLRGAAAVFGRAMRQLQESSRLTVGKTEPYRRAVHLHLNRFRGRDRAAERRVIALLWRVREGLHRTQMRVTGPPQRP